MKVLNIYEAMKRPVEGQTFDEPSLTVPDLALSLKQLYTDYSIGQLPSLSQLQNYLDIDTDDVEDDSNDLRFEDKAEMFRQFLESNNLRKEVYDRVKKSQDYKREQELKEFREYKNRQRQDKFPED